jgi:hypothetical protein
MLKKKEDIQGGLIWKRQSGLVNLKWKLKNKQKNKKGKENIVKKERGYIRRFDLEETIWSS